MGEIAGLPQLGGGGIPLRLNTDRNGQGVPPVEATPKGRGLDGRMPSGGGGARAEARRGDPMPDQETPPRRLDVHTLTGPSPAFQATVLELERELRQSMARIEAAQGLPEAASAIAPPARAESAAHRLPDASGNAETPPAQPDMSGAERDG